MVRFARKVRFSETTGPASVEVSHNPVNEMVRRLIDP